MNIPIAFPCVECGKMITANIGVEDSSMKVTGPCGHQNQGMFGLSFTRGSRILLRARQELQKQDFSMAIVLSAVAFEAELSRLHHKWEYISALQRMTEITDQTLDELLRRYQNIRDKIEYVCKLMQPTGIDDFVSKDSNLNFKITNTFPSLRIGSLASSC